MECFKNRYLIRYVNDRIDYCNVICCVYVYAVCIVYFRRDPAEFVLAPVRALHDAAWTESRGSRLAHQRLDHGQLLDDHHCRAARQNRSVLYQYQLSKVINEQTLAFHATTHTLR